MITKCFVTTMFGRPFDWIEDYILNVQKLEESGWYWKIFTSAPIKSKGNVEIISMGVDGFNKLVESKFGINPNIYVTDFDVPSLHVTDFYIFSGVLFEEWLKGMNFWGITNMDVVYGRLDHFYPDSYLEDCDVFTDDVNTVNGVFSLWRNKWEINNLFQRIGNWKEIVNSKPCPWCTTHKSDRHQFWASDEYAMTEVMKQVSQEGIRYKYPKYYPLLSHDRLEQHLPSPKLKVQDDGSLWELFNDVNSPNWVHSRPVIGREIPLFHFGSTKRWPILL